MDPRYLRGLLINEVILRTEKETGVLFHVAHSVLSPKAAVYDFNPVLVVT